MEKKKVDKRLFQAEHVLFITTKNIDYLRNIQEIEYLHENSQGLEILFSDRKKYFGRILEIYLRLLRCNCSKFDLIFIGFAPQLILPLFHWKFKNRINIDFFISVYDTLVNDRQIIKQKSFLAKFCKWIDNKTLKYADQIVVDTQAHGEFFLNEFKLHKDKINVLYLKADEKIYYPRKQKKEERLKDKYVVLYFGSILPLQGVDIIIKAASLLKENKDIFFQIIGPIREKKYVGNNIEYISWLSQQELAEYIANADLCLAGHFHGEIEKAKRTIPGKAYIYECMKKKMILGDNPANHELFKEDNTHIFVEMGNEERLVEVILREKRTM